MSPRPELRIAPIGRQRAKDLDPDFLRDVRGQICIAHEPTHHRIDVRRVLRPERLQCSLIPLDGASQ
jgi:hypothetical protein